jgi:hypothetical protein
MINFKNLVFFVMIFLCASTLANAQPIYQGQVSFVPAGTPVSARLEQTLSSEFSKVGETFTATLAGPIYAGNQLVAGPGSAVQGQVVAVEPAGRGGKPGSIDIRLTSIIAPNGQRFPLSARIDSNSFQLSAEGSRVSHLAKTTAVGAGAGALSGLVGAAIGGGQKGKTTAIGTGIGAGVGLLGGAIKKGAELALQAGTTIPFILDQPMQVNMAPPVQQFAPEQPYGFQDPYGGTYQAAPQGGTYQQQPALQNPYL